MQIFVLVNKENFFFFLPMVSKPLHSNLQLLWVITPTLSKMALAFFFHARNQKLIALINQKENVLAQRKVDIKNMEEGFETLQNLYEYVCAFAIFTLPVFISLSWNRKSVWTCSV